MIGSLIDVNKDVVTLKNTIAFHNAVLININASLSGIDNSFVKINKTLDDTNTGVTVVTESIIDLNTTLKCVDVQTPVETEVVFEPPSSYEIMRLAREEAFDTKIKRLKEELAMSQPGKIHTTTPAATFHPDVYNLPLEQIPTSPGGYVEEVAK